MVDKSLSHHQTQLLQKIHASIIDNGIPAQDAQLCSVVAQAANLQQQALSNTATAFVAAKNGDIALALEKTAVLDEHKFHRISLVLLWIEALRQKELPIDKRNSSGIMQILKEREQRIAQDDSINDEFFDGSLMVWWAKEVCEFVPHEHIIAFFEQEDDDATMEELAMEFTKIGQVHKAQEIADILHQSYTTNEIDKQIEAYGEIVRIMINEKRWQEAIAVTNKTKSAAYFLGEIAIALFRENQQQLLEKVLQQLEQEVAEISERWYIYSSEEDHAEACTDAMQSLAVCKAKIGDWQHALQIVKDLPAENERSVIQALMSSLTKDNAQNECFWLHLFDTVKACDEYSQSWLLTDIAEEIATDNRKKDHFRMLRGIAKNNCYGDRTLEHIVTHLVQQQQLDLATEICSEIKDDKHRAKALQDITCCYLRKNNVNAATELAHTIPSLYEQILSFNAIALYHVSQKQDDKTKGLFLNALELATKITENSYRFFALSEIAKTLQFANKSDQFELFSKAKNIALTISSCEYRSQALTTITHNVALSDFINSGDLLCELLKETTKIDTENCLYNTLREIFRHEQIPQQRQVYTISLKMIAHIKKDWDKSYALSYIAQAISKAQLTDKPALIVEILQIADNINDFRSKSNALSNIAMAIAHYQDIEHNDHSHEQVRNIQRNLLSQIFSQTTHMEHDSSEHSDILVALVEAMIALKDFTQAQSIAQKIVTQHSRSSAWEKITYAFATQKRFSEAFQAAISINNYNRGKVLSCIFQNHNRELLEKPALLAQIFDTVTQTNDSDLAAMHHAIALVLFHFGNTAAAMLFMEKIDDEHRKSKAIVDVCTELAKRHEFEQCFAIVKNSPWQSILISIVISLDKKPQISYDLILQAFDIIADIHNRQYQLAVWKVMFANARPINTCATKLSKDDRCKFLSEIVEVAEQLEKEQQICVLAKVIQSILPLQREKALLLLNRALDLLNNLQYPREITQGITAISEVLTQITEPQAPIFLQLLDMVGKSPNSTYAVLAQTLTKMSCDTTSLFAKLLEKLHCVRADAGLSFIIDDLCEEISNSKNVASSQSLLSLLHEQAMRIEDKIGFFHALSSIARTFALVENQEKAQQLFEEVLTKSAEIHTYAAYSSLWGKMAIDIARSGKIDQALSMISSKNLRYGKCFDLIKMQKILVEAKHPRASTVLSEALQEAEKIDEESAATFVRRFVDHGILSEAFCYQLLEIVGKMKSENYKKRALPAIAEAIAQINKPDIIDNFCKTTRISSDCLYQFLSSYQKYVFGEYRDPLLYIKKTMTFLPFHHNFAYHSIGILALAHIKLHNCSHVEEISTAMNSNVRKTSEMNFDLLCDT